MIRSIAIVDDDQEDIDLLMEAIHEQDAAAHCISFVKPVDAFEVLSTQLTLVPEFLFIDLNMPLKTGHELVGELRNLPEFVDTVIVVLSTGMAEDTKNKLIASGANFAFRRPNQFAGYSRILATVFAHR